MFSTRIDGKYNINGPQWKLIRKTTSIILPDSFIHYFLYATPLGLFPCSLYYLVSLKSAVATPSCLTSSNHITLRLISLTEIGANHKSQTLYINPIKFTCSTAPPDSLLSTMQYVLKLVYPFLNYYQWCW